MIQRMACFFRHVFEHQQKKNDAVVRVKILAEVVVRAHSARQQNHFDPRVICRPQSSPSTRAQRSFKSGHTFMKDRCRKENCAVRRPNERALLLPREFYAETASSFLLGARTHVERRQAIL